MRMLGIEKFLVNNLQSKKRAIDLTKKLFNFIENNGKQDILEVGCGNGLVTRYLAKEYNHNVTGIDIDPEQIELARKETNIIENVHYYEAEATNLPCKDMAFDIVLSFGTLHHIENWLDALKEIKRVLKHGGYFLYADVIYSEKITSMDRSSSMSFGLVTINIDELNSFLEKFGFTTIHYQWKNRLVCKNYEAVYRLN